MRSSDYGQGVNALRRQRRNQLDGRVSGEQSMRGKKPSGGVQRNLAKRGTDRAHTMMLPALGLVP